MKRLLTLALLLLFFSCESNTEKTQELSDLDRAAEILASRGYDVTDYSRYTNKLNGEEFIVVENDHMFNIKDLLNRGKQYRTTNLLSDTQVKNIRVAIYQGSSTAYAVPNNWAQVTRENFSHWNGISGTKVNFTEVSYSSGNYDIVVYVDDLGAPTSNGMTIARSSFPESNGDAGSTVIINKHALNSFSNSKMVFTMTHEFGHSLGFRHTNWFDRNSNGRDDGAGDNEGAGSIGAVHLAGTPTGLDESSIMKATVLNWNGFSNYDEIALRVMYPSSTTPPPTTTEITGPNTVADGQAGTFTAPTGSSYQWYYDIGSGWRRYKTTKSISFTYNGYIDLAVVVDGKVYYKRNIYFY